MWIGAIRLIVQTKNAHNAGTDHKVTSQVLRDGEPLVELVLDYPTEDDLERGARRAYDYVGPTKLPRRNDQTPQLPDGVGQSPMPYPGYGLEFSKGLSQHLTLRTRIRGDDLWIKDKVDLYVQQIRRRATSFDTIEWRCDEEWTYVASWTADKVLSTDPAEGVATLDMKLS